MRVQSALADDPSSVVVSAATTDNDRETPEDNIHCMLSCDGC